MSLFKCSSCGCVEDTAIMIRLGRRHIDPNRKALCSECDPKIEQWHGQFEKRSAEGMYIDSEGFLWDSEELCPRHLRRRTA